MENKYKAIFYPLAVKEAEEIFNHIAVVLCNKKAALSLIQRFEKAIDNICIYPQIGALIENEFVANKTIRKYIVSNHIIFYKIAEEKKEIHIIAIVNKLRDYVSIL